MRPLRIILLTAVLAAASAAGTACQPAPVKCKASLYKYDHKTGFVTWVTLYNEMRFCYDGTNATSISWTDNRTSNPTPPYGRGSVTTTKLIENYDGTHRRARNLSRHAITCAKVLSGFDVSMRQLGYGSGTVTQWRSSISSTTDC